jgi:hypothetical protein
MFWPDFLRDIVAINDNAGVPSMADDVEFTNRIIGTWGVQICDRANATGQCPRHWN